MKWLRNIILLRIFDKITVMKTKLTLNIEQAVVRKAKVLSKRIKRSISAIVEDYLLKATTGETKNSTSSEKSFSQHFREKFPAKKGEQLSNYKQQRHAHLIQKYGS